MHEHINNGHLKIRVRTGMPRTELIGWDESIRAYRIDIHSRARDNKANAEILKLVKKATGKRAQIKCGLKSTDKLIRLIS